MRIFWSRPRRRSCACPSTVRRRSVSSAMTDLYKSSSAQRILNCIKLESHSKRTGLSRCAALPGSPCGRPVQARASATRLITRLPSVARDLQPGTPFGHKNTAVVTRNELAGRIQRPFSRTNYRQVHPTGASRKITQKKSIFTPSFCVPG